VATVTGTGASEVVTGTGASDRLLGLAGDDTLNGNEGDDRLEGGPGDDIYIFATGHGPDRIIEVAPGAIGGIDTLRSAVTINALAPGVENLVLTGGAALNGTGNNLDNRITGNAGHNRLAGSKGDDTLDGGAGNDTLIGGLRNDVYIVAQAGDQVVESVYGATDTVYSSVSHTLTRGVERLYLTGSGNTGGIGNGGQNHIDGTPGDNLLVGGAGHDRLNGHDGNDILGGGYGHDLLWGGAGADAVFGRAGEDTLIWDAEDTVIDGGDDSDRVVPGDDDQTIDLTDPEGPRVRNIEAVDLNGDGDNLLIVDGAAILAATPGSLLLVMGAPGEDSIQGVGLWVEGGTASGYVTYTQGDAVLVVHQDVDRSGLLLAGSGDFLGI
jgi:Ca2+-binding RTX toxin-like protein